MIPGPLLPSASFPPKARLIVAVSGGPDSMSLLSLLVEQLPGACQRIVVAHVNYGLRGRDSRLDEKTVREFCQKKGIAFRVLRLKGFRNKVLSSGKSLQDFARETRYSFFERLVRKERAWGVAVAHHLEDQAETVMDRFLRGTGAKGLSGLKTLQFLRFDKNSAGLRVWRPLLSISRNVLLTYLKTKRISWRKDQSNQGNLYRRNQIRNLIFPYLSRWNQNLPEALARLGEITAAEDELIEELLVPIGKKVGLKEAKGFLHFQTAAFQKIPLALKRRWARLLAKRLEEGARGLSFQRVEEILRLWEGREKGPRDLGFELVAGRMGNRAFLRRKNSPSFSSLGSVKKKGKS